MENKIILSKELHECINEQINILNELVYLIRLVIAVTVKHPGSETYRKETTPIPNMVARVIPIMLQAIGSSTNTIISLSHNPGLITRDCYCIERSIVETAVNICYIIAEGDAIAEKAIHHASQKAYRDLDRETIINGQVIQIKYSAIPDLTKFHELQNEIQDFTTKRGKEKDWTDLSIDQRIESVGKKLDISPMTNLQFARVMVYRHSSEILHGSYFGSLYFFGAHNPNNQERSLLKSMENIGGQHMLILFANIISITAIIEAIDVAYGCKDIRTRLKEITNRLFKLSYYQRK